MFWLLYRKYVRMVNAECVMPDSGRGAAAGEGGKGAARSWSQRRERMMSEMRSLEDLREQAEVEQIYRNAVETLSLIVMAYAGTVEEDDVIERLVDEHPGSNVAFWYGVVRMTAEAMSDDRLVGGRGRWVRLSAAQRSRGGYPPVSMMSV